MPPRLALSLWALALPALTQQQQPPTFRIDSLTGADMPDEVSPLTWSFSKFIYDLALDRAGDLWIMEGSELRKLTRDGRLLRFPLKGTLGGGCDASEARLNPYYRIVIGPDGLPYVSDPWCDVVWRILPDGSKEIFAGRLDRGAPGNDGPANQATLRQISAITFDAQGNFYIAEHPFLAFRKVDTRGIITALPSPRTLLPRPFAGAFTVDPQGNIYALPNADKSVYKIAPNGDVTILLANSPNFLSVIARDPSGNLFVSSGGDGSPITRISPEGKSTILTQAKQHAFGLATDSEGNLYFGDAPFSLGVLDPQGKVRRIAGTGMSAAQAGVVKYTPIDSLNGIAVESGPLLWLLSGSLIQTLDPTGKLQVVVRGQNGATSPVIGRKAHYHIHNASVWKLDFTQPNPVVVVVQQNEYRWPSSLAIDPQDNLFIAYGSAHRIQRFNTTTNELTPFVGTGADGDSGDGGPALQAQFRNPRSIALARDGSLYVADSAAARVRKITPNGNVLPFAGTGSPGAGGEDGPALSAQLNSPASVAVDLLGNVYIAESVTGGRILQVDPSGTLRRIAGGPGNISTQDGIPALSAKLSGPTGLAVAPDGIVYFVDRRSSLRRLIPEVTSFPRLAAGGALHAATFQNGPISPGLVLTLFGQNLGAPGQVAARPQNSRLPTEAGLTYVLFSGTPGRLLYASPQQVSVLVPYALQPGATAQVVLSVNGADSLPMPLTVAASNPGLFTADGSGSGYGAILNQDGSLNSPSNRAKPGSIVILFGTGEGKTTPDGVDGLLAPSDRLPKPVLPVVVSICGESAEVLYSGAAPGLTAGVAQLNVRIPQACAGQSRAPIRWTVGEVTSPPVFVAVE